MEMEMTPTMAPVVGAVPTTNEVRPAGQVLALAILPTAFRPRLSKSPMGNRETNS